MTKQSIKNSLKLLSIIRKHTDKNHPITQSSLRELIGENASDIMGDKGTFARRLREIADSQNMDDEDILPEDEWRIVYPGYVKKNDGSKNGKLYYNHVFSDTEIDFFIKAIRETDNFTKEEKESLERRLLDNFCSKFYQYPETPNELIIEEKTDTPEDRVIKNIATLRDNIKLGYMVEFDIPEEDDLRVSPYFIIKKDGYFWLIGNCHIRKPDPEKFREYITYTDELTAYRIDLMTYIRTAHTVPEQYIHYTTTNYKLNAESYTRINYGNRITKARFNQHIQNKIAKALTQEHFEHGEDI